MKKAAITTVPKFYQLSPAPSIACPDPIYFAKDAAVVLLEESKFLQDGQNDIVECYTYIS